MKKTLLTLLAVGGLALAGCNKEFSNEAEFRSELNKTGIRVVEVPYTGEVMLRDFDRDGQVDSIQSTTRNGGTSLTLFKAPGYENAPSSRGYTKPMSPKLRAAATKVYHGLNELSFEVAKGQGKLREK